MKRDIDFDHVGKRMPYTVPDTFFPTLEDKVRQQAAHATAVVEMTPRRPSRVRHVIAAAACAGLLIAGGIRYYMHQQPPAEADTVEAAFAQLSEQDQACLIELAQDDVFINGQK